MIYSQHPYPYDQSFNNLPQGYPMYYQHYQQYPLPFESYQVLSNVIPITEPLPSTIIYPQETVIERYPPLQIPKKVPTENTKKEKRKNFTNLDNNPYLFTSARIRNYSQQQQPSQGYQQQSNNEHQVQFQTNRLESTQRILDPQIQSNQQNYLRQTESKRTIHTPQLIQEQSINDQIDQRLRNTQQYPTANIQQSKILEQRDYYIQSQNLPKNELDPQYQVTAQFQPLLSKSLNNQTGRQLIESKSPIIQSTIQYNAPKQRPGLNVDLSQYKSASQSLSQSKLRRSRIFD